MEKTVSRFWGAEQAYLNATANTQEKTGASGNSPALSRHRHKRENDMLSKTQTRILQNILDGTERSLAETAIQSVIREKLPRFLTEADANLRRDFFVQIEIIASEATGRKISTHPLRPSEVTKLVETHKAEVARLKAEAAKEKEKEKEKVRKA